MAFAEVLLASPTSLTIITAWATWYIWKFVISPSLHPDEPPEYPYWMPIVGHMPSMLRNAHNLYSRAREHFGNTREPFSMTIMGESSYVVTSPDDIQAVFKTPKALDFDPFIRDILSQLGVNNASLEKMFADDYVAGKNWMQYFQENFKLQLHPGDRLEVIQDKFLGRIDSLVTFDDLEGHMVHPSSPNMLTASGPPEKLVSLYKWAQEVLVDSATCTFFDECIYDVAPELKANFYIFEEETWKLPFQLPYFAAKRLHDAKKAMDDGLTRYLELPNNRRPNESWLMRDLSETMDRLGIAKQQRAPTAIALYQLINTNAYKSTFWLLAYILFDNQLRTEIESEIVVAFDSNDKLDRERLIDSCPLLNSVYEETLRLTNWPMGVRSVMEDVLINGKRLRKGKKLFMPYRQLHFNPTVYGADVDEFNPRRFLHNTKLTRTNNWRAWGGGPNLCPGRFIARREVLMLTALILRRFEVILAGDGKGGKPVLERISDGLPSGGVQMPKGGDDILLFVRPRAKM